MRIVFGAVFALAASVSHSFAAWDYEEYPSAFTEVTEHLIGIDADGSSLVLRCRSGISWWFFTENLVPRSVGDRLNAGEVGGAYRIDDGPIVSHPAEYDYEDGKLVVYLPADMTQVSNLTSATQRIAAAVTLDNAVLFETHFDVEGANGAAEKLIERCR